MNGTNTTARCIHGYVMCGTCGHAPFTPTNPVSDPTPGEREARANVYLDTTMSTPEDLDAYRLAVRRALLAEIVGILEEYGSDEVSWPALERIRGLAERTDG